MRLGIKILNVGATLNSHTRVPFIRVARGETLNLYVQLVDLDQKDLRYIPDAQATVRIQIPRSIDVVPGTNGSNSRTLEDLTINRLAAPGWGGEDRSIWYIPLSSADTESLISNSVRVVVTETTGKKIGVCQQAIQVINSEDF